MLITFKNEYVKNSNFGINFQAIIVENAIEKVIVCVVSQEALQDVRPANRMDSVEIQFETNRSKFELKAREKILDKDINEQDGRVYINASDL